MLRANTLKADIDALRVELVNVVQSIKGLGTTAMAAAKREPSATVDRLTSEAAGDGHRSPPVIDKWPIPSATGAR